MLETKAIPASFGVLAHAARASVIVVNYNGKQYLDACLGSLLTGDHHRDEIIVLDNASSDDSAGYVERNYPQVRVIRNQENSGFAVANNAAASLAHGQYLAFLNPDTRTEPGWLDALIDALESDPGIGLVTARIMMLNDPDRINTCGNQVHLTGLTLCRGTGQEPIAFPEAGQVSAVSGAAFAVRKELYESLGGFDHQFFMYMEDTDLSLRAQLAGYKCVYVPSSVVYHDYQLRFGPNKTFYQERNRYLTVLKLFRWPTLLVLLPAYLLAEIVTWGFVLSQDRQHWTNKVRVYQWIASHWRQIMASRRDTQATRQVNDRTLLARCTHELAFEQTGDGLVARLAHGVFDPLFLVFHRLALALVRW